MNFIQPYIIAITLPTILAFSTLTLIFLSSVILRPAVHKDPADAFLVSLIAAGLVFLVVHIQQQVLKDPWDLDMTWRGVRKAAKTAEIVAGREILSLEVEIDHQQIKYQTRSHEAASPDLVSGQENNPGMESEGREAETE